MSHDNKHMKCTQQSLNREKNNETDKSADNQKENRQIFAQQTKYGQSRTDVQFVCVPHNTTYAHQIFNCLATKQTGQQTTKHKTYQP